ncbi:MipA/OmpV family protein [Pseudoalteromonas pernae]|uniref:MipA/OmpV family protein n=1 Tax=Pseudoalteromonas pernae TaxID=3118054 RepID=UPI00324268B3
MNNLINASLVVLACSFFSQSVMAQEERSVLVPLPSFEDFTEGHDGWAFGLGLGIEYESAYEGSDEFELELDPVGAVQWRKGDNIFFWAGEAIGWRGLRSKTWLFEVALAFEEGREESDSDDGHLDGLGEGEEGAELVLQLRHAFDDDWRYWFDGRVTAGENGNIGLLGFGRRFGDQSDGSGHELSVAVVFHDSEYANTDFGIDMRQAAASGLQETDLGGGLRSVGVNYHYRHYINDHWEVFAEALYEGYFGDIKDSPITRNNYEAEVGGGFVYVF